MAEFSLQELHNEIEADPEGIGYKDAGVWKGDQEIADLINAKNYTIDRAGVEMEDVRAATAYKAYNDLLADKQEWLVWMTPNSGLFVVTPDMKLVLTGRTVVVDGIAGTGDDTDSFWGGLSAERTAMVTAMLALIEIPGSRAGVLWCESVNVSLSNVSRASLL